MSDPPLNAAARHLQAALAVGGDDLTDRELLARYADGDTIALARLVRRHGPLVYGVCRRFLRDPNDVDDAFQATFLALVVRSRAGGWRESVAGWLHEVATRVSAKARVAAARRAAREREAARMRPTDTAGPGFDDLAAVLDEELHALSESLRDPLVLCHLEGLTVDQAAHRLGTSLRTLERRLRRGRAVLASRLRRRGVAPGVALLTAACSTPTVTGRLIAEAVRVAAAYTTDPTAGSIARITALALGALQAMRTAGHRLTLAVLIAGGLLAAGGVGAVAYRAAPPPAAGPKTSPPAPTRAEPRDRHGDPLPAGAVARMGTTRLRQPGRIAQVGFSPDGSALIAASDSAVEGGLYLWDPRTGKEIRRLEGHRPAGPANNFATDALFSVIAGPADGNAVRLWEAGTGKVIREFKGHTAGVSAVALSPDGGTLISVSRDQTLRVWDVATGKQLQQRPVNAGALVAGSIFAVGLSPDGRTLAVRVSEQGILGPGRLQLSDVATGREIATLRRAGHGIDRAAFAPDGRTIATSGHSEPVVRIWDATTGAELRHVRGKDKKAVSGAVAFSPDGRTLLTAFGGRVQLWDAATGKPTGEVATGLGYHSYLALSPDGQTVATGNTTSALRLWDVATGQELHNDGHTTGIRALNLSPDGILATVDDNTVVRWWRVGTGEPLAVFEGTPEAEYGAVFTPDGTIFATTKDQCRVTLRESKTGKLIRRFQDVHERINGMWFSSDGKVLATYGGLDGSLVLWDVATGKKRRALTGHRGHPFYSAFTPDGKRFIAVSWDSNEGARTLHVWDTATGRAVRRVPAPNQAVGLALAPDGKTLAITTAVGPVIHLWDLDKAREIRILRPAVPPEDQPGAGSGGEIRVRQPSAPSAGAQFQGLTFSPDGKTLATGGTGTTVRLFDVETGRERRALTGHRNWITALAYSADGRRLISASEDGTALAWDVRGTGADTALPDTPTTGPAAKP